MAKQLKKKQYLDMIAEIDEFLVYNENVVSDRADWTSTGRLFQSRGPAVANERSPTVTSRDGRTSRRLEVDELLHNTTWLCPTCDCVKWLFVDIVI